MIRNSLAKGLFSSYFILTILAIVIMSMLSNLFFQNILEKKSLEYQELMISSVNDKIETQLGEFDQISFQIYHPEIHSLLNDLNTMVYNPLSWDYQFRKGKILTSLFLWEKTSLLRAASLSISFIDKEGKYYIQDGWFPQKIGAELLRTPEFQKINNNLGGLTFQVANADEWYLVPQNKPYKKIVLVGRKIVNTIQARDLGVLIIAVNFESITRQIEEILHDLNSYFILLDDKSEISV